LDNLKRRRRALKEKHEKATAQLKEDFEKTKGKSKGTAHDSDRYQIKQNTISEKNDVCENVNFKHTDSDQNLWKDPLNFEIVGNSRIAFSGKMQRKDNLDSIDHKKVIAFQWRYLCGVRSDCCFWIKPALY